MKYEINEVTPKAMSCTVGPCPAIYEVEESGKKKE